MQALANCRQSPSGLDAISSHLQRTGSLHDPERPPPPALRYLALSLPFGVLPPPTPIFLLHRRQAVQHINM
eukprot:CAMPEP_0183508898 /NCGR_PEP_ID=MMETSP0371-20130417/9200_1 /TAXON_ID=268820 /ORGANISM="Peridinium aciculiferum, Strain PAER-2" /LENGTH=70 /DNA_ID=CAMNT_0025705373 /DNA_START=185 /DNA_END=397 /DNA_ORIENTATION=-